MSSLKEQIVRELIDLLQRSPEGRKIDIGSLVIYLDEEVTAWIFGTTLHLGPLYDYCEPYTGWTEDQFMRVIAPLEARLSHSTLRVECSGPPMFEGEGTVIQQSPFGGAGAMAAVMATGGFSSFSPDEGEPQGFSAEIKQQMIDAIIRCTNQTKVEEIIDPSKLRGFLEETIDEMYDNGDCDLQMLWDILLDAPGVSEDMLIPAFLLIEREEAPAKFILPSLVQKLPANLRETMLAPFGLGGGASSAPQEPAAPAPTDNSSLASSLMIQRSQDKAPAAPSGIGASSPPRSQSRAARPAKKPDKKAGKQKKKGGARGAKKGGTDQTEVSRWLIITAVVVIVVCAIYYFFGIRKSKPSFKGQKVNIAAQHQKFFTDVRYHKGHLVAKVKAAYQKLDEGGRLAKAQELLDSQRGKRRIFSLALFDASGKRLQTLDAR